MNDVLDLSVPFGGVKRDARNFIGTNELIRLITEGLVRMGSLSIPTSVPLSLASGSGSTPLGESLSQSFTVNLNRFVASVKDIQLFLRTYSNSVN